jgi:hypothetical protein
MVKMMENDKQEVEKNPCAIRVMRSLFALENSALRICRLKQGFDVWPDLVYTCFDRPFVASPKPNMSLKNCIMIEFE